MNFPGGDPFEARNRHFRTASQPPWRRLDDGVWQMNQASRFGSGGSELEAGVRRLIDANLMGIFIWHLDGRIVEANEAFLRIGGYDRDDSPRVDCAGRI
jgi:PAS domain-containing protein